MPSLGGILGCSGLKLNYLRMYPILSYTHMYLLRTYYVSGTVLGPGGAAGEKKTQKPLLQGADVLVGRTKQHVKYVVCQLWICGKILGRGPGGPLRGDGGAGEASEEVILE